jgi:hypothetical protein
MATADEAVKMLSEVLTAIGQGGGSIGIAAVYHPPSTSLRMAADDFERKEALFCRAKELVRTHSL